ncbi:MULTISPECIES: DUF6011 domain-containing protein [unclassified Streptomyces]|uniref:DUF6011 domain-containing protein n=1 Tax=unclassified Streptomyces TaxID=2593676 RepID=UPI002E29DC4B|nr:DUF6011 domain-containing protein [Streptomyces sp. NBC_00228]
MTTSRAAAVQLSFPDSDDAEDASVPGVPSQAAVRAWRLVVLPGRDQGALFAADAVPGGAEVLKVAAVTRAGRCALCKRPLRSEASQAAGVGPECAAKLGRTVHSSAWLSRRARTLRALAIA